MDLTELFRTIKSPEERHRYLHRAREETRRHYHNQPLTGAWYWVPEKTPRGVAWRIEEFFDVWHPSSDHIYIWRHVRGVVEHLWQRSLKGIEYCSLPRGRVSRMRIADSRPKFATYHGHDSPVGHRGLVRVRKCFQLPADCQVLFDEHERCISGQPEALSQALGYDLKVRGVEVSDLDWTDE